MTDFGWVLRNAEYVISHFGREAGFKEFGYNEQSVAFLEDYIVRMRRRGLFGAVEKEAPGFDKFATLWGCYLGEAIIERHGGRWNWDEGDGLHILYDGAIRVFPISKVAKLMRHGLDHGDSILGFYTAFPRVLEKLRADTLEDSC